MDFWLTTLNKISEKISNPSFEAWFFGTNAEFEDNVITVGKINRFVADWLENRYKTLILKTVREVTGQTYEIEFISSEDKLNKESMMVHNFRTATPMKN